MVRRLIISITIALAATFVTVVQPAASQAAYSCPVTGAGLSRGVICHAGPKQYRIAIHCVAWHGASSRFVYGPWFRLGSGKPSTGWCGFGENVGAAWAQHQW